MRRRTRTTTGAAAALALLGSSLLIAPTPAAAINGQAVINPIESNIAEKFWVSATASSGGQSAAAAIDQDPSTAWHAANQAPGESLTLDLGGTYDNLRKVEVVFPDTGAVYQYRLQASPDGTQWTTIGDRSANARPGRGGVDLFTSPGTRYVRVTITGVSPGATVGISEVKVFNYLRDELILGADISYVDDFQTRDYWVNPLDADRGAGPALLDVVKDRGMEYVRLRVFNEPRSESSGNVNAIPRQGPERTLTSAQWVKQRGLGLGVDFHYADSWADPGKQPKPRAWAELSFPDLQTALYDYTYDYVRQLVNQGTTPDKVAVGNEVNNGFLWGSEATNAPAPGPVIGTANPAYFRNQANVYQSQPGGGILWQYWNSTDPAEYQLYLDSWERFSALVAKGIAAVRAASPTTKVEVHSLVGSGVGNRTGLEKAMEYWHQLLTRLHAQGQDIDVIALSYYPEHHGTMESLERNMYTISTTYPKYPIIITETAYPASGNTPQPNSIYPRTIQGQADAIQRVIQANNDLVNNQGVGMLTWEPASFQTMFRSVPGMSNTYEPHASIDIYNKSAARHVLENTIYTATTVGSAPALPSTVKVLTTAGGAVADTPVTWNALPEGATSAAGQVTVTGTTERGPVTAVVDVVTAYRGVACTSVITGSRSGPLVVSTGVTCLNGATVSGPVTVRAGAGLVATGARISGPITATGAAVAALCGTTVSGPVRLDRSEAVQLGNPMLGCASNTISGPVSVTNTTGWNVIAGNTIAGPLSCSGNTPPPVNNAAPNKTAGPRSGQCAGL
ncbi:glycosyl hydrolase 53 family protein [Phytohabitans kaempferiae]|uniref:Arabinogalactan endo-beta-1,4-galactanase n=1 Tax=Phytohabitans kaempferiae TaxID=1620943 RepID=A0ABV6M4A5_9ACTN